MNYARIDGTVVTSAAHSNIPRWRTAICQPLDKKGRDKGIPVLALDPFGASLHQRVVLSTDGSVTRALVAAPKTPLRNVIIAILDPISSRAAS